MKKHIIFILVIFSFRIMADADILYNTLPDNAKLNYKLLTEEIKNIINDESVNIKLDVSSIKQSDEFSETLKAVKTYDYIVTDNVDFFVSVKNNLELKIPIIFVQPVYKAIIDESIIQKNIKIIEYAEGDIIARINDIVSLTNRKKIFFITDSVFLKLNSNYGVFEKLMNDKYDIQFKFVNFGDNNLFKKNIDDKSVVIISQFNQNSKDNEFYEFCKKTNALLVGLNSDKENNEYLFATLELPGKKEVFRRCASIINNDRKKYDFGTSKIQIPKKIIINQNVADIANVLIGDNFTSDIEVVESKNEQKNILTLSDGIKQLVSKNKSINISELRAKISILEKSITKSSYYPELNMAFNNTYIEHEMAVASAGMSPEHKTDLTMRLSGIIYSDKLNTYVKINEKNIEITELDRKIIQNELCFNFVKLYFELLKVESLKKIQEHNIDRIKTHIQYARNQYTAGATEEENVLRWESELGNNKLSIEELNMNISVIKRTINLLIENPINYSFEPENIQFKEPGVFKNVIEYLNSENISKVIENIEKRLTNKLLKENYELQKVDKYFDIKQMEKRTVRREYYIPSVGFGLNAEHLFDEKRYRVSPPIRETDRNSYSAQLSFNLPVFDGFRKKHNLDKITNEQKIIESQKYLLSRNLEKELKQTLNNLIIANKKITWSEYSKDRSEKAYLKLKDKYSKGLIDLISIVDIQKALLINENQVIISEYDFLNSIIKTQYLLSAMKDIADAEKIEKIWKF